MTKKVMDLINRLNAPKTTHEAIRLFERDFLPLGPEALEAIPHLFKKLSILPGTGGGNGLTNICYDGFVKIPGSFGEQGHNVAVKSMVQEVLRISSISFMDLDVIVTGVCGSVKRGATGEEVLRALEEFKSWLPSSSPAQQFKAGSKNYDFVQGKLRDWQTTITQAIQNIKATFAPEVSSLPASGHEQPAVSAREEGDEEVAALIAKMEARMTEQPTPEEVPDYPSGGNRSARGTASGAVPAKDLNQVGKLSIVCECGHRGTARAEYAGRTVKCPKCQRKIRVPG